MTDEDDWLKVAANDDTLVVQLLLKLRQPLHPSRRSFNGFSSTRSSFSGLGLHWSVRQRRSAKHVCRKKLDKASCSSAAGRDAATRASPTTPLSWSGGGTTSVSGGGGGCAADGFEESSLPAKTFDTARSKVAITSETPTTKRSRKKKTLPELKDEETLLLKEKRNLKTQLAKLRLTLENQRAANESLKRLKVDLLSSQMPKIVEADVKSDKFNSNQLNQIQFPCDSTCSAVQISSACNKHETSSLNATLQKEEVGDRESSFMLPDLNLPVEDNSGTDVLYGIS